MIRFHFGRGDGGGSGCGRSCGFGCRGGNGDRMPRHRPAGGGTDGAAALSVSPLVGVRGQIGLAVQIHRQNLPIRGGIERRGEDPGRLGSGRLDRATLPGHRTGESGAARGGSTGVLPVGFGWCGHGRSGRRAGLFLSSFLDRGGSVLGRFCWSWRSVGGLGGGG